MALGGGANVRLAEPVSPRACSLRERSRHPGSIPSSGLHSDLLEVSEPLEVRSFLRSSMHPFTPGSSLHRHSHLSPLSVVPEVLVMWTVDAFSLNPDVIAECFKAGCIRAIHRVTDFYHGGKPPSVLEAFRDSRGSASCKGRSLTALRSNLHIDTLPISRHNPVTNGDLRWLA